MSDIGVIVYRHKILILHQPLLRYRLDFVHQVKLKAHGLLILILVIGFHPIAVSPTSAGMIMSLLYASRNSISLVGVLAVVRYAHRTLGSSFGQIPFALLSQVLMILSKDQFMTLTCPLACGCVGDE